MRNQERVVQEKWGMGPGPIVFTGGPTSYQGYVELINSSAEELEPRAIAITDLELNSGQGRPPPAATVCARLGPYEHLWVPIEIVLDPATPPGSYTGQLSCGSQREDVVIKVPENWDLRIVPQRVTVIAGGDATVALRILITNLGNSEFTVPSPASVHLTHDLDIGRHLNTALRAAGKEGYEKFLDRFVLELAGDAVGDAIVQFKPEGAKFRTGETKPVELQIRLPDDLRTCGIYRGTMKLRNARLMLEVKCTGERKASPRRRK
jgi:hypothetical protein